MPTVLLQKIDVCICTYRRPELLRKLLTNLECQQTQDLFNYSVVVADNDAERTAEAVVEEISRRKMLSIKYCVEARKNIALVRNQALRNADGDLIAFIDDDEFPGDRWLCNLYSALEKHGSDGVLGPVKPFFEAEPPQWVTSGGFFVRPDYITGYKLSWPEARTGNVLFRRSILQGADAPFDAQFDSAGEDVDFFRRMMAKGGVFVWCSEADVFELVPASRCTSRYLLRRALLRGSNFPKHGGHRVRNALKSVVAVPSYTIALPFIAMFGKHYLMKYLIKLCDHGARLLAHLGLQLVTQRET